MTATPMQPVRLDARVTNEDGRPVRHRQAASDGGGWWFRVRRSPGQAGVELAARIPGCEEIVTRHPDQEAADAASRTAYSQYRADVETALSGGHRTVQEAS
jgi:hypothetical protein